MWGVCDRCAEAFLSGGRQPQQIADGAEQRPLAPGLGETLQEELSKASGLFDLADDRLNHLLAELVSAAAPRPPEFRFHGHEARVRFQRFAVFSGSPRPSHAEAARGRGAHAPPSP